MFNNSTIFIGIDLGDKYSVIVVLDQEGDVIEESRIPTTQNAFTRKFKNIPSCRIAMEVGAHSRWASQTLKDLGHEVIVADARKLAVLLHRLWISGEVYEPFYASGNSMEVALASS